MLAINKTSSLAGILNLHLYKSIKELKLTIHSHILVTFFFVLNYTVMSGPLLYMPSVFSFLSYNLCGISHASITHVLLSWFSQLLFIQLASVSSVNVFSASYNISFKPQRTVMENPCSAPSLVLFLCTKPSSMLPQGNKTNEQKNTLKR